MALRCGSIFLTKDTTLGGALPKPHFLFASSLAPRNHFASHLRGGVGGGYDSHLWVWGQLLEIPSPRRAEAAGRRRGSHTYLAKAAGNRRGRISWTRTPAPRFLREGRQCAAPPAGARGRLGPSTWRPRGSELPPGPRPGRDERWIPPRGHRPRPRARTPPAPARAASEPGERRGSPEPVAAAASPSPTLTVLAAAAAARVAQKQEGQRGAGRRRGPPGALRRGPRCEARASIARVQQEEGGGHRRVLL